MESSTRSDVKPEANPQAVRMIANQRVTMDQALHAHTESSVERMKAHKRGIEDETSALKRRREFSGAARKQRSNRLLPAAQVSHYSGWRVLIGHKQDISRVAELAWELGHSSATNAYEIYLFEFGFAYMPGVSRRLPTVLTHISTIEFDRVAQVSTLARCFPTVFADVRILFHLVSPILEACSLFGSIINSGIMLFTATASVNPALAFQPSK
jgi:hypothetical protein